MEDELVIGDPFEHGVNGLFLDDDFNNMMTSLGMNKYLKESSEEFIHDAAVIESVAEVIKNRKITN